MPGEVDVLKVTGKMIEKEYAMKCNQTRVHPLPFLLQYVIGRENREHFLGYRHLLSIVVFVYHVVQGAFEHCAPFPDLRELG